MASLPERIGLVRRSLLPSGTVERLVFLRALVYRLPSSFSRRAELLDTLELRIESETEKRPPTFRRENRGTEILRRLERVEQQVAANNAIAVSGTVTNLTRAWMRQQHDIANLTANWTADGKRVDDTLRFLLDRVEFVRREIMFEIQAGARTDIGTDRRSKPIGPKILDSWKVSKARDAGALRLNLGCGHIASPDYINVDMRDLPGVDVISEAGNLPFEAGTVDEISSVHLLEHFPQEELRRRLLPYWFSLLKSGGIFRAITPDGAAMLSNMADNSYSFSDFREALFGSQDYEGDFHFNMLTPDSLQQLVEEAGFCAVEIPVSGRRNGQCFEFELIARVPSKSI